MNHAALSAPEQPASWALWVLWAILCVFAFPARAAGTPGQTPFRMPFVSWGQVERNYNPAREVPFEGPIGKVRMFRFLSRDPALGVELSTGEPPKLILIAPSGFLSGKGFTAAAGLQIKGVGAKKLWKGGKTIIAREITLQGRTLPLRERGGKPLWNGPVSGKAVQKKGN